MHCRLLYITLFRVTGKLELITVIIGQKMRYKLDRMQVYYRANTETNIDIYIYIHIYDHFRITSLPAFGWCFLSSFLFSHKSTSHNNLLLFLSPLQHIGIPLFMLFRLNIVQIVNSQMRD